VNKPKYIDVGRWRAIPHQSRQPGRRGHWWWVTDREGFFEHILVHGPASFPDIRQKDIEHWRVNRARYDDVTDRELADLETLLLNLKRFFPAPLPDRRARPGSAEEVFFPRRLIGERVRVSEDGPSRQSCARFQVRGV
jgi:hypothetical protein